MYFQSFDAVTGYYAGKNMSYIGLSKISNISWYFVVVVNKTFIIHDYVELIVRLLHELYRCSALPTELSSQLGAGQFVIS